MPIPPASAFRSIRRRRTDSAATALAENYAPKAHTGSMPSLRQPVISAPVPRSLTPDPCSLTPLPHPHPHPPYQKHPLFRGAQGSVMRSKSNRINHLQDAPGGRPVALVVNTNPRKTGFFAP
jgi:hypothetical protein